LVRPIAGLAVGYWKEQATLARQWQPDRKFKPAIQAVSKTKLLNGWAKALNRSRD
jgi:glycerol kinase